jgi:hypothetical protein
MQYNTGVQHCRTGARQQPQLKQGALSSCSADARCPVLPSGSRVPKEDSLVLGLVALSVRLSVAHQPHPHLHKPPSRGQGHAGGAQEWLQHRAKKQVLVCACTQSHATHTTREDLKTHMHTRPATTCRGVRAHTFQQSTRLLGFGTNNLHMHVNTQQPHRQAGHSQTSVRTSTNCRLAAASPHSPALFPYHTLGVSRSLDNRAPCTMQVHIAMQ